MDIKSKSIVSYFLEIIKLFKINFNFYFIKLNVNFYCNLFYLNIKFIVYKNLLNFLLKLVYYNCMFLL